MKQTTAVVFLTALCLSWSSPSFAQAGTDPYTTSLGLRYDFSSHASGEASVVGFNADVTRMLGGFATGGGFGVGGGVDVEKFDSAVLKEFEAYVAAQGKATGKYELSPFGRFGLGINSESGATDLLFDFRGGVDFKPQRNSRFLISAMISVKRVFADVEGFNVLRLSAGIVLPLSK